MWGKCIEVFCERYKSNKFSRVSVRFGAEKNHSSFVQQILIVLGAKHWAWPVGKHWVIYFCWVDSPVGLFTNNLSM